MIDVGAEELFLLTEAARRICPSRPPNHATVWRWCQRGLRGGARLDSVRVGGRRYTSAEAIARFLAAQNEPRDAPEPVYSSHARDVEALRADGFKI